MIRKLPTMLLALLPWLSFNHPASAGQAGRISVGTVERMQNLAEAVYAENTQLLTKNSHVKMRDLLKTAADSRLKIQLKDGSNVAMGENAELIVDRFVYTLKKKRANKSTYVLMPAGIFLAI